MERFSQNELRKKVKGTRRLERAEDIALVLAELETAGFIARAMIETNGNNAGGRPRSPVYKMLKGTGD